MSHLGFSQKSKVKIGDNPYTLNALAALEVESTTKGFLPPRMTSDQKNQIPVSTDTKGLTVYCTNCAPEGLYTYNGTDWTAVGSLSGASLGNGKILIGNSANAATAIAPSGDVTINNTGVTAIGANKVTNGMLLGSIDLSTKVTGILPVANGGTGSSTQNFVDLTTNQTIAGTKAFGAVTASTINKVAVIAPSTGATLTIADGKTLTASNSIVLAGTDGKKMTFPATDATIARTDAAQIFAGTQTFNSDISVNGITVGRGIGISNFLNIAVGSSALSRNTTGSYNTALGSTSLYNNTTGNENTALGSSSLYNNTTGSYNTALGSNSLLKNTIGSDNTTLGSSSLYNNTTGSYNTALGSTSLYNNTTGNNNIALGPNSLYSNTTGSYNTALGISPLYSNTTGNNNIALGPSSLVSLTGDYNIGIGASSGGTFASGNQNIFIGHQTYNSGMTSGNYNTIIGSNLMMLNSNLNNNIILADGQGNMRARYNNGWTFENVTLPNTGTLATLDGTETLSNKTLTSAKSVQFVNSNADVTLNPPVTTTTPASITLPSETGTLNTAGPSVSYFMKGDQGGLISAGGYNKVLFDTKVWDESSTPSSTPATTVFALGSGTTASRFIPKKPGIYSITAQTTLSGTTVTRHQLAIYKNSAIYKRGAESTLARNTISCLVAITSATDYIELYVYVAGSGLVISGAATTDTDSPDTYFQMVYIRPLP